MTQHTESPTHESMSNTVKTYTLNNNDTAMSDTEFNTNDFV